MRRIAAGASLDELLTERRSADGDEVLRRLEEVARLDRAGDRERALLRLYISQGACSLLPIERFRELFASCDRARLLELCDPLPPGDAFTEDVPQTIDPAFAYASQSAAAGATEATPAQPETFENDPPPPPVSDAKPKKINIKFK